MLIYVWAARGGNGNRITLTQVAGESSRHSEPQPPSSRHTQRDAGSAGNARTQPGVESSRHSQRSTGSSRREVPSSQQSHRDQNSAGNARTQPSAGNSRYSHHNTASSAHIRPEDSISMAGIAPNQPTVPSSTHSQRQAPTSEYSRHNYITNVPPPGVKTDERTFYEVLGVEKTAGDEELVLLLSLFLLIF